MEKEGKNPQNSADVKLQLNVEVPSRGNLSFHRILEAPISSAISSICPLSWKISKSVLHWFHREVMDKEKYV